MADVMAKIRRDCPGSAFELIEQVVADVVGPVIYGAKYPEDKDVDVAPLYARLGTFMALRVEVDTEDLPEAGWVQTASGLCVPQTPELEGPWVEIDAGGPTDAQRNAHFKVQAKTIHDSLITQDIWKTPEIGWTLDMDPSMQLGVLVVRAEGAWHASYTN